MMATLHILCFLCILPILYTQAGSLPKTDLKSDAKAKTQIPVLEFRAHRGSCLEGSPLKSIEGLTINNCQDACASETDFLCRAVEYKSDVLQCDLREDSSKYTRFHAECTRDGLKVWDLYEVVEGALWFAYTDSCIAMESKRVIQNMLLPDFCKILCEDEAEFRCLAFNYNYQAGTCELGADTRSTRALLEPCTRSGFDAYERTSFPHWKDERERRINSTSYQTVPNVFVWDCIVQCWNNPTLCNSVNYEVATRTCYLYTATTFTHNLLAEAGMHYYELFYRDERWRHYTNACMANDGRGLTISDRSMPGCLAACEMNYGPRHEFDCLSVNYRTTDGFCTLFNTTTNSQDQLFMTPCLESEVNSFHEIMSCDGPTSEEAGIRKLPSMERAPWPQRSNNHKDPWNTNRLSSRLNNRPSKDEIVQKQKN